MLVSMLILCHFILTHCVNDRFYPQFPHNLYVSQVLANVERDDVKFKQILDLAIVPDEDGNVDYANAQCAFWAIKIQRQYIENLQILSAWRCLDWLTWHEPQDANERREYYKRLLIAMCGHERFRAGIMPIPFYMRHK